MIPGEVITSDEDIILNSDRKSVRIVVANSGDRPIQVGSHYHFLKLIQLSFLIGKNAEECDLISQLAQR